jgi:hypothetical protein
MASFLGFIVLKQWWSLSENDSPPLEIYTLSMSAVDEE